MYGTETSLWNGRRLNVFGLQNFSENVTTGDGPAHGSSKILKEAEYRTMIKRNDMLGMSIVRGDLKDLSPSNQPSGMSGNSLVV